MNILAQNIKLNYILSLSANPDSKTIPRKAACHQILIVYIERFIIEGTGVYLTEIEIYLGSYLLSHIFTRLSVYVFTECIIICQVFHAKSP